MKSRRSDDVSIPNQNSIRLPRLILASLTTQISYAGFLGRRRCTAAMRGDNGTQRRVKLATEYRVDPRHLIVAVCRKNRANAPDDLVREEADRLSRDQISGNWKPLYEHYMGGEQGS